MCPGINDGDALDDTLLGVLDRFPRLATVGVVPLGVSDHTTEPEHATAHARPRRSRVLDTVAAWQERFTAALGRRLVYAADEYYLLAGDAVPRRSPTTTASRSTRTASAWPGRSQARCAARSRGSASTAATARARALGSSPGSTARRREGYRAATRSPRRRCASPTGRRRSTIVTGEYGAEVLTPLLPATCADVARSSVDVLPVANRFFGGNIAVTGLLTGRDVARALERRRPTTPGTCSPTSCSPTAASSTALTVADLPRPVEIVADRRRVARRRAALRANEAVPAPLPVVAVVGRPNVGKSTLVNRFVGRRRRDRRGEAGRHARPQGARGRVERPPLPSSSTPAAGSRPSRSRLDDRRSGRLTRQVSLQAERAIVDGRRRAVRRRRHRRRHRGGRSRRPRSCARPSSRCSSSPTRSTTSGARPTPGRLQRLGLGDPYPGLGASTGGGAATSSTPSWPTCPPKPTPATEAPTPTTASSRSPSSGARTSASPRSSTGSSATSARSCTTCPARRATAIDTIVETEDGPLRFVDTAGMRRRSRIDEPTEYFSLVRALESVDRVRRGAARDRRQRGRHAPGPAPRRARRRRRHRGRHRAQQVGPARRRREAPRTSSIDVADRLAFLAYAPVLKVSAPHGKDLRQRCCRRSARPRRRTTGGSRRPRSTALLQEAQANHPAPPVRKHRPRVLYATQGAADPPTFTLFVTHELPPTYLRYLERRSARRSTWARPRSSCASAAATAEPDRGFKIRGPSCRH